MLHVLRLTWWVQAEGGSKGLYKWYKRAMRKQAGRMLAIGDGANDVAMIQVSLACLHSCRAAQLC